MNRLRIVSVISMHDPTAQLALLATALELAREPMFVIDCRSQRVLAANPAACAVAGCGKDDLVGSLWTSVSGAFPRTSCRPLDASSRLAVVAAYSSGANAAGSPIASRDVLTGLPGRAALAGLLERERQGDRAQRLAVLFIDLDGFKLVNDQFGHVTGDCVLRAVAERLMDCVRPSDLVLRYGGDEFLVVIHNVARRRDLERLARRIQRGVGRAIAVEGREFVVSASVGMARRTAAETPFESLVVEADRAMYRAKALRRAELVVQERTSALEQLHRPRLAVATRRRPPRGATA